jgi:hypothetical protein
MRPAFYCMLALVGIVGLHSIVVAQYEPTWSPPDMMANYNLQFNPVVNDTIERGAKKSPSVESSDPNRGTSLSYSPNKSRTVNNLRNFVAKSRASDPAGAAQMEQLFASMDVLVEIGNAMSSVGLSRDNVADAFALYWVNAWQIANGDSSTPSKQMMQAVATQAAKGLLQSQEFAAATEAQKQEMAEALMVQGALIASAFEQAAGDQARLDAIGAAVAKGAEASGLELDKMTLTEDGFVPKKGRKGADASGAVGNEEVKQASAAGSDNTLQYGLMAALGLGAAFMIGKGMRKG